MRPRKFLQVSSGWWDSICFSLGFASCFLLQNLQLTPKTPNSKHSLHQLGWNYYNLTTHTCMHVVCVCAFMYVCNDKEKKVCLKIKIRLSLSKDNYCHSWLILFQIYFYAYTLIHLVFLLEGRWFWNCFRTYFSHSKTHYVYYFCGHMCVCVCLILGRWEAGVWLVRDLHCLCLAVEHKASRSTPHKRTQGMIRSNIKGESSIRAWKATPDIL